MSDIYEYQMCARAHYYYYYYYYCYYYYYYYIPVGAGTFSLRHLVQIPVW
jgi:hypothetical protein